MVLKMTASREIPCYKTDFALTATSITLPVQSLSVTTGTSSLAAEDFTPSETTLSPLEDICQGLGISENKPAEELHIYPDPSHEMFTVSFTNLSGNSSLTIFNSLGKPVYYTTHLPGSKERTEVSIRLNASPGIYLIRVIDGASELKKKLIIE